MGEILNKVKQHQKVTEKVIIPPYERKRTPVYVARRGDFGDDENGLEKNKQDLKNQANAIYKSSWR